MDKERELRARIDKGEGTSWSFLTMIFGTIKGAGSETRMQLRRAGCVSNSNSESDSSSEMLLVRSRYPLAGPGACAGGAGCGAGAACAEGDAFFLGPCSCASARLRLL